MCKDSAGFSRLGEREEWKVGMVIDQMAISSQIPLGRVVKGGHIEYSQAQTLQPGLSSLK